MLKQGHKTSEFWLTAIVGVAALLASLAGELAPRYAAIASAVSTGLYAVSRGFAKSSLPRPPAGTPPQ